MQQKSKNQNTNVFHCVLYQKHMKLSFEFFCFCEFISRKNIEKRTRAGLHTAHCTSACLFFLCLYHSLMMEYQFSIIYIELKNRNKTPKISLIVRRSSIIVVMVLPQLLRDLFHRNILTKIGCLESCCCSSCCCWGSQRSTPSEGHCSRPIRTFFHQRLVKFATRPGVNIGPALLAIVLKIN